MTRHTSRASMRHLPRAALLLMLMVPAAADVETRSGLEADAYIALHADGDVYHDDPDEILRLTVPPDGAHYAWNLSLPNTTTIIELSGPGTLAVDWVRQAVLELDDSEQHPDAPHLHPHAFDLLPVTDAAQVNFPEPRPGAKRTPMINITGTPDDFVYRIAVPGPGNATLTLRNDTSPPTFELGDVTDLNAHAFQLETKSDEPTIATLFRQHDDDAPVPLPTTSYDKEHRFPVQGMRADTEYTVWVTFKDWAGHVTRSANMTVRTEPEPLAPRPYLTDLTPARNATVPGPNVQISAVMVGNGALIPHDQVRFFFDKSEIHDGFQVENGQVSARFGPLAQGPHSVAIEIENQAGGEGHTAWTFFVASDQESPPLGPLAVLATLTAALVLCRPKP